MKFNINNHVKVKLTPTGIDHYKNKWSSVHECQTPLIDEQGWYKSQLWCLMRDFGDCISMGRPIPFETEIEICDR